MESETKNRKKNGYKDEKTRLLLIFGLVLILALAAVLWWPFNKLKNKTMNNRENLKAAVFAGGCFWCVESDFEKLAGVSEAISGFAGGDEPNPSYKQVSSGSTGHRESVQVFYNPEIISYEQLVRYLFAHSDPTDNRGQFVDRGAQYKSGIFYADENEKEIAERVKKELAQSGIFDQPIVTEILPLKEFYPAEDYHQDYYQKSSLKYKFYRFNSGRDAFLKKHWSEDNEKVQKFLMAAGTVASQKYARPSDAEIKEKLTDMQYRVTQKEATEPAFDNQYWDNKKEGIYVDIVSGEPLFSSTDKFESSTGWPSFTVPIKPGVLVEREDRKLFIKRTEVRSSIADSHLGHVFNDGPAPTGLRYCINSAALRFVPKEDLAKEGYEDYVKLFE